MFIPKIIASKEITTLLSYTECLAKTINSEPFRGYGVLEHCLITGKIARALCQQIPNNIFSFLPFFYEWPAASHDVGKICPTFQKKIQPENPKLQDPLIDPNLEKNWGGHATVSALTFLELEKYKNKDLAEIVGKHHATGTESFITSKADIFGGEAWHQERVKLLHTLAQNLYAKNELPLLSIEKDIYKQFLLGLTVVSDWIGSGDYFQVPDKNWENKITESVLGTGFKYYIPKEKLSFADVFGSEAYPIQKDFYEQVNSPGLYILEAPMGIGKTEAALYAAYKILSSKQAKGIYFALPTQLTSDKIYNRVSTFLKTIYVEPEANAYLLHGKAWLKAPVCNAYEENNIDTSWFSSKKRALLAPFGVGTIDQALLSVINVRHSQVRTFGLAGKVVILDEVHSYDAYTGTLINELVKNLLDLNCTVIVLSATLSATTRQNLLPQELNVICQNNAYPLLTCLNREQKIIEKALSFNETNSKHVSLSFSANVEEVISQVLVAVEDKQQVLWIENTIDAAQEVYRKLVALLPNNIELGLLHSRFIPTHRQVIEEKWITLFGKESKQRQEKGRILVGTQVLEQSIDIDADLLVTDFCPTDMLLQRLGRLHRHKNLRPKSASCQAIILTSNLQKIFENLEKTSVYDPYILARSFEIWQAIKKLTLPKDIRYLIDESYSEREEQGALLKAKNNLKNKIEKLRSQARASFSLTTSPISEETASTRLNDLKSVELLLLKDYEIAENGTNLTFLNNEKCFIPNKANSKEYKILALMLMENMLSVPEYKSPPERKSKALAKILTKQNENIYFSIVKNNTELDCITEKYTLAYHSKLGYIATKKGN